MKSLVLALFAGLATGTPVIDSLSFGGVDRDASGKNVEVWSRQDDDMSPFGGARVTITGANLVPANYDSTDANRSGYISSNIQLNAITETAGIRNLFRMSFFEYFSHV